MNDLSTQPMLFPSAAEWNQMTQIASALLKSNFLPTSIKSPEAAVAIMLMGREIGVPPMRAFSKISVINGKPAMGAELLLSRVFERYPNADIQPVRRDAEGAVLKARRSPKHQYQEFSFLLEDARRAEVLGKDSWKKYPKAMYYWRAVSDMVRSIWPEVLGPASHTPEELGAEVNEEGEVIEATIIPPHGNDEPPPPDGDEPPVPEQDPPNDVVTSIEKLRKASIYDDSNAKLKIALEGQLAKAKIAQHKWPEIRRKMDGRIATDLHKVVAELT